LFRLKNKLKSRINRAIIEDNMYWLRIGTQTLS
jgi:hypothetical protein